MILVISIEYLFKWDIIHFLHSNLSGISYMIQRYHVLRLVCVVQVILHHKLYCLKEYLLCVHCVPFCADLLASIDYHLPVI